MKEIITAEELNKFLFDEENGFLVSYHFEKGIDLALLDELYDILENLKSCWKSENCVPKDLLFLLVTISPSLYMDLPSYTDKEGCEGYADILYNLDTAISMCLNPNTNDPHFDTPLKELGNL